eukprot:887915-Rhodomonas_salina.1
MEEDGEREEKACEHESRPATDRNRHRQTPRDTNRQQHRPSSQTAPQSTSQDQRARDQHSSLREKQVVCGERASGVVTVCAGSRRTEW